MTPHDPFVDGLPELHEDDSREGRLAVGWALHALEPAEELDFAAHRPGCPVCERLVAETTEVLGALAEAVPDEEPPPGLRDAILAAAGEDPVPDASERPQRPRRPQRDDGPPTGPIADLPPTPSADPVPPSSPVLPRSGGVRRDPVARGAGGRERSDARAARPPRDRRRTDRSRDRSRHAWRTGRPPSAWSDERRRWVTRSVAAAVALLALVAVGGLVATNNTLRAQRDEQAAAAAAASTRANEAAAGAASSSQVLRVMADAGAPGVAHAALTTPSGALVGLITDGATGPEMVTTGLAANRGDQTYVLWGLATPSSKPVGITAFDVSGSAPSAPSVGSVPRSAFAGYAVSLEPGRTMPAAPTQVVASGQVSG